jgi:hypothetical protein
LKILRALPGGIEQVRRCTEDRTAGCSVRRHSARWALRHCADKHRGRELFEFCNLKKNPLRDIHRVAEYPDRLSKRLLE